MNRPRLRGKGGSSDVQGWGSPEGAGVLAGWGGNWRVQGWGMIIMTLPSSVSSSALAEPEPNLIIKVSSHGTEQAREGGKDPKGQTESLWSSGRW